MYRLALAVSILLMAVFTGTGSATPLQTDAASTRATQAEPTGARQAAVIQWYQAKRYAGLIRTVRGPVKGTKYAASSSGRPTFLNIGRNYPSPKRFTVVIWGKYRSAFPRAPERMYRGKTVMATGRIRLYQGSAQMFVRTSAGLRIVN